MGAVSAVQQKNDPSVFCRANDPACCLENPVHARILVGVFEARFMGVGEIRTDQFPFRRQGGQSDSDDDRPGQPVSGQIDTFSEYAAHDGETDQGLRLRVEVSESIQVVVTLRFAHGRCLDQCGR